MNIISDNFSVSACAIGLGAVFYAKGSYDIRNNRPLIGRIEQGIGILCLIGGIAERYLFVASDQDTVPFHASSNKQYTPDLQLSQYAERSRRKLFNDFDVCVDGIKDLVKIVGERIWVCCANGTEESYSY